MIYIICSIYDKKSNLYQRPFAVDSTVTAMREFRHVIEGKAGESVISQYPEDFELFKVGKMEHGEVEGMKQNELIISGNEIKSEILIKMKKELTRCEQ